jgi:hypothetical protein
MIEPIMYLGIGFMAACLMMLTFFPLVHGRAVRLTTRRVAAATPESVTEMRAEKDLLRAEFAMSMRRVEVSVEETKAKAVNQLCEAGRKMAEVQHLKIDLDRSTAQIIELRSQLRKRKSVIRSVAKLVLYLFARSRRQRPSTAPLDAFPAGASEDWQIMVAQLRMSLQKAEMAHGGT